MIRVREKNRIKNYAIRSAFASLRSEILDLECTVIRLLNNQEDLKSQIARIEDNQVRDDGFRMLCN